MGTVVCEGWAAAAGGGGGETGDRGYRVPARQGAAGTGSPGTPPQMAVCDGRDGGDFVHGDLRTTILIALVLSAIGGLMVACGPTLLARVLGGVR